MPDLGQGISSESVSEECTCILGHQDHSVDCYCTTSVLDCAVHCDSGIGRAEQEILDDDEAWRTKPWFTDRLKRLLDSEHPIASGRESAESWQIVNLAATLSAGAATTSEAAKHQPSSVDRGRCSYGQRHPVQRPHRAPGLLLRLDANPEQQPAPECRGGDKVGATPVARDADRDGRS